VVTESGITMWCGSDTIDPISRGAAAFGAMQATTVIGVPHVFAGALFPAGSGFTRRLWVAVAVTVAFTLLARWLRGVSLSGSIAGAIVCFVLYAAAGAGAFAALVTVFVLTWVATQFGYRRKQKRGTAESGEGRTASQVLANLATAAGFAGASALSGKPVFMLAAAAALSEAAADTVSSEFGQAHSDRSRLITTWKVVPAGTDGGVTVTGTVAGMVAAVIVSGVCLVTGLIPWKWARLSLAAGVAGMIVDSFLGALLERRKLLSNDWVNFLSTLIAAGVALLLA
jgi:uncharacterized protein (TIGR00297 family)